MRTTVTGVEMFKKVLDRGEAGDNVGLLLRGIKREDVLRGQVACKPGSITPHSSFEAEIYALSKDEGGRHTPFFSNYRQAPPSPTWALFSCCFMVVPPGLSKSPRACPCSFLLPPPTHRPQFFFRTADITGTVELPDGIEMVMPGDNVTLKCQLITPVAMEPGLRFALREGGRTVGAGVVSKASSCP